MKWKDNPNYDKERYQRDKEYFKVRAKRTYERNSKYLQEYKSTHPCIFCGEYHPVCLDFHHLVPSDKRKEVSRMVTDGNGLKTIDIEINKCIVLCRNCHAKLHAGIAEW